MCITMFEILILAPNLVPTLLLRYSGPYFIKNTEKRVQLFGVKTIKPHNTYAKRKKEGKKKRKRKKKNKQTNSQTQ